MVDNFTRREIRSLKSHQPRRSSGDQEEPLVDRESRQNPLPISPFERHGEAAPRDGRLLWGIARERIGSRIRRESGRRRHIHENPSILESFLFNLSAPPQKFQRSISGTELPPLVPGVFEPFADAKQISKMITSSYMNVLLFSIPVGMTAGFFHWSPTLIFCSNFLALIPLALILGEITEDLAIRFGDAIGGLLNASFGNIVEGILGVAALSKGLYKVVAASLIGSILSNLLLVLGCCFFFGGLKHKHQAFNPLANKVSASLLFLACISVLAPTLSFQVYGGSVITPNTLLNMSHTISLFLIGMYGCYLYFQLKTHASEFSGGPEGDCAMHHPTIQIPPTREEARRSNTISNNNSTNRNFTHSTVIDVIQEEEEEEVGNGGGGDDDDMYSESDDENQPHTPALSLTGALVSLSIITLIVAISSEFLTGAIEEVSKSFGINPSFLGLIVLPIAGNAAEHITAVFVALKNKMDLAISVALGSSIQIAFFILPMTVLIGWAIGCELTLDFDPFAVGMLTLSVVLAYFVTSDGLSNWILGLQLIVTYVLIGSVFLLEKEDIGASKNGDLMGMVADGAGQVL